MIANRARRGAPGTVPSMRTLTSTGRLRGLPRRAATMLEFALILPMFMFMMMFTLDMGHLVLMSGAMQDATFSAARTGAQVGGAGIDTRATGQGAVCPNGEPCKSGSTYRSLMESAAQIPGYNRLGKVESMKVVHGAVCLDGANDHVQIKVTYSTDLVTPGLTSLLKMVAADKGPTPNYDHWTLTATGIARCEVIRSP